MIRPFLKTAMTLAAGLAFAAPSFSEDATLILEPAHPAVERPYDPASTAELYTLLDGCEDDSCRSYLSGVIGGITVYGLITGGGIPFCATGDVTPDVLQEAILTTIETTENIDEKHPVLAILQTFAVNWPCDQDHSDQVIGNGHTAAVSSSALEALLASDRHSIVLGNPDAEPAQTLVVFDDANCPHCIRFHEELLELEDLGWKVVVYPVAVTTAESTGYAAVQLALRDSHPDIARGLFEYTTDDVRGIDLATSVAIEGGVSQGDLLTLLAMSNAFDRINENTRAFYDLGATGTPSWIYGLSLYSGSVSSDAIQSLAETFEGEEEDVYVAPHEPAKTPKEEN